MALWNQAVPEESSERPRTELPPSPPASPALPAKEVSLKSRRESVFGAGVSIEGKIEGDADVRVAMVTQRTGFPAAFAVDERISTDRSISL